MTLLSEGPGYFARGWKGDKRYNITERHSIARYVTTPINVVHRLNRVTKHSDPKAPGRAIRKARVMSSGS